jgi:hypothetical protein
MVTQILDKFSGRGVLFSGQLRVSEGKYEINTYDERSVTRAHGWFELDVEGRLKLLDISKAELRFNRIGKHLKLVIANLPTGNPVKFEVHEESISDLP